MLHLTLCTEVFYIILGEKFPVQIAPDGVCIAAHEGAV